MLNLTFKLVPSLKLHIEVDLSTILNLPSEKKWILGFNPDKFG